MATIYERLGVPAVINGVGPATRLGGLPLHPEVFTAMQEAVAISVRMDRLEAAAGARIASLLGVPGVYVTSGASAALFLATAAVMARGRAELIDQLPDTTGMRHKVIVQSAQRDPYDRAVTAAGATLVPIGYPDSTHPGELERVLDDDVAAVLYRPGKHGNLLDLEATCRIAHAHGVPVMIDGAMFVPPVDRLRGFFDAGADLVAVSGGKGFRGPQASGLLCGTSEFIDVIALQHQDMDERDTTWPRNRGAAAPVTPPRHGIGRPMKVGREQIAGLLTAIERYVRDPGADERAGTVELDAVERVLNEAGTVAVTRVHEPTLDVPGLQLDISGAGADVDAVVLALGDRETPVYLGESEAWRGVLTVNGMALGAGEGESLAGAVLEVIAETRK
ncbi:MAG: hypothetical protein JWP85_335 [Rhodoglobus sp.]|nr:hypothetical protein [Rhodoglobus sp.]